LIYNLLASVSCTLLQPKHESRHSKNCWNGTVIADGMLFPFTRSDDQPTKWLKSTSINAPVVRQAHGR
jgi:hypothetical protein